MLTPANRLLLAQSLEGLRSYSSVLNPVQTVRCRAVCEEALLESQTVLHAAETILASLEENFIEEVRERWGGNTVSLPLEQFLRPALHAEKGPFRRGTGPVTRMVNFMWERHERAVERVGRDRIKVIGNYTDLGTNWDRVTWAGGAEEKRGTMLCTVLMDALGPAMGAGFYLTTQGDDLHVRLRLLPPSLLIGAAHLIFGRLAVEPQFTAEMSTLDQLRDMTEQNRRPLLLAVHRWDGHNARHVHPYIAAIHDVYHMIRLSDSPKTVRKDLVKMYDAVHSIPDEQFPDRGLKKKLLDKILDGPSEHSPQPYQSLFRTLKYDLDQSKMTEVIGMSLHQSFLKHPRRSQVLKAWKDVFEEAA